MGVSDGLYFLLSMKENSPMMLQFKRNTYTFNALSREEGLLQMTDNVWNRVSGKCRLKLRNKDTKEAPGPENQGTNVPAEQPAP